MATAIDFTLKQNDTSPSFDVVVMTGLKEVVDLTGFTAPEFHMWNRRTRAVVVDTTATIAAATGGLLRYTWLAADTDVPGLYEAEFQITDPAGGILSIPNDGYFTIEITPEVA